MSAESNRLLRQGATIALVPTMGFLHKGHLTLMTEGKKRCDKTVASIFVNPTQFAPGEDLDCYPRDFQRDVALAEEKGVDIIFAPTVDDLYGKDFQTFVELTQLPGHLCGISRPTHFRGVATIVSKLFNIVKPHVAVFGKKDFQQLAIIKQMARDLNFDVEIVGVPIVREENGLAMSSRNANLAPDQIPAALSLSGALKKAREMVEDGILNSSKIIEVGAAMINSHSGTTIDYISICDPETLVDVDTIKKPALMALAVRLGNTRLIDNDIFYPKK
jgi:pantoate--beta-alanine ligase